MTRSTPELLDLPLIGAADPTPAPPAAPARKRGVVRLLALPAVAVGCFAAGVAGSLVAAGGHPAAEPAEVAAHHDPAPHPPADAHHDDGHHPEPAARADDGHHQPAAKADGHHQPAAKADEHHPPAAKHDDHADAHHPAEKAGSHKDRIDLAARAGRFAEALALLHEAPAEHLGMDERAAAYREAVCLEGLGRRAEAAAAYEKAANPAAPGWADLGRARCRLAAGDRAAARDLMTRVSLVAGADEHLLAECLYLRAWLLVAAGGPRPAPDPLDAETVAWPTPEFRGEHTIAHLPAGTHSPEADHRPEAVAVFRSFWCPGHAEVSAVVRNRPAATFFDQLREAGLAVTVEPDAAARLTAAVTLDVHRAPVAEVLAALGFGGRFDGDRVVIGPVEAAEGAGAADGLRRAVAADPDHPLADAARVALANLHAEAGRWRPAADDYRRFLEQRPNSAEAVRAAYNLGLAELREANTAVARGRFLEVVDRGPKTRWADLGRWWVARTHLDAGDTAAARKPLRQAFAGAAKDVRSAAALGLVAADLFDGDGDAARSRLRTYRFGTGEAHALTAGWFDALLRYRAVPSAGRAAELADLLRQGGDGKPLGAVGAYLAGKAWAEAGRPERMAAVYDRAAEACRGPLAVRMTFEAAEHLWALDRVGPARQRFLAVAAVDPVGLGLTAELRLAELDARVGSGAGCVARCRRLLARPGADPAAVLPVMARGFERDGKYRAAADCLAGRVPGE